MEKVVLRWGRSAHETDDDLAAEAAVAAHIGATWRHQGAGHRPDLRDVWALVVNSGVRVGAEQLAALAGRRVLTTTSGFDHLDLEAARAFGVTVARCPEARADAVAEFTLGCLIEAFRHLGRLWARADAGVWARAELPMIAPNTLRDARVVVVGAAGEIGGRVVRLLDAVGARVVRVDPRDPRAASLDEALAGARAVTLHCDLNPTSRGMFHAGRIAALPAGCVLVNTARGELVDPTAAAAACRTGHLGGWVSDVFPVEPPSALAEWVAPNTRLSPHGAGYTLDLGRRVADEVGRALRAWSAGAQAPHTLVSGDG